ncbi:CDP-diacylglycerol--glycerol-3-phosphate 3-phosphatidyltransferase [Cellulomonas sp. NPDC089187]|uniref:CDP-diacylglycerol--glycerol-3-phosphate 3-phosphatidyltransferase n=1 Tax=Cellulomonas sp. NPDC089187 TaxID=3154970 RepID=UPI00343758E3
MVDHRPPVLNVANVLTVLRIVVVPFFGWALVVDGGESVTWRLVATGLFVLAAITDQVDGHLARRMDLITDLGKLLDPIADKLLVGAALVLLAVLGELPWWVPAVILARELGITVMRFFLLKYLVLPASRGGKIKTVLQIAALTLFLLPLDHLPGFVAVVAWVLMVAAVVVTVLTGADYVRTAVRVHGEHRRGLASGNEATRHAAATGTTAPDGLTE